MQIAFDKLSSTPKPFELLLQGVSLSGTLHKQHHDTVILDGTLGGALEVSCDRCGISFDIDIEQPLKLELSQHTRQNKDNLDIIEFLDGIIDLEYVLQSEIDSIKSTYHYCEKCDGIDNFEVEI
ncbi:MAG: YceD family protein [Sulfurovaceae bacterium]